MIPRSTARLAARSSRLLAAAVLATLGSACRDTPAGPVSPAAAARPAASLTPSDFAGWTQHPWIGMTVVIQNLWSGTCLDVPGFNAVVGQQVAHYPCNWGLNQQFVVEKTMISTRFRTPRDSVAVRLASAVDRRLFVRFDGGVNADGRLILLGHSNVLDRSQQFHFAKSPTATGYVIETGLSSYARALDVYNSGWGWVQQFSRHGGPNQQWLVYDAVTRVRLL